MTNVTLQDEPDIRIREVGTHPKHMMTWVDDKIGNKRIFVNPDGSVYQVTSLYNVNPEMMEIVGGA